MRGARGGEPSVLGAPLTLGVVLTVVPEGLWRPVAWRPAAGRAVRGDVGICPQEGRVSLEGVVPDSSGAQESPRTRKGAPLQVLP